MTELGVTRSGPGRPSTDRVAVILMIRTGRSQPRVSPRGHVMLMSTASHSGTTPGRSLDHPPLVPADVEIVVPVYNEAEQLAASITALRAYLDSVLPLDHHRHYRRQRQHRRHVADRHPTGRRAPRRGAPSTSTGRAEGGRCGRRGRPAPPRWSPTWTSIWPRASTPCCPWWPPCSPVTATWPSAPVWRPAPTWSGAPAASSSPGATTSCSARALGAPAPMPSADSRPCAREAAAELLPLVEDDEWFFDTEVLVTAQRLGLRIHEVPVDWVDDTDSRVDVVHTALKDLRGVWRMLGPASRPRTALRLDSPGRGAGPRPSPERRFCRRRRRRPPSSTSDPTPSAARCGRGSARPVFADELLRFAGVGAVSTVAYAALFAALEPALGSYLANAVAIGRVQPGQHRRPSGYGRHRPASVSTDGIGSRSPPAWSASAWPPPPWPWPRSRAVGLDSLAPGVGAP